jgi:hypothetical protein
MQKGLMWGSVVVAVLATFGVGPVDSYALVLVVLGLVMGFMNPIEDVATRVAMYVLAVLLPTIADNLDVIPVVGEYANGILSQFALVIAGVAIMQVCLVLKNSLMAAGDDSDGGDDETESAAPEVAAPEVAAPEVAAPEVAAPEVAAPEVAAPEAPSWGGDDSGDDDSDGGDDEAEDTRNV